MRRTLMYLIVLVILSPSVAGIGLMAEAVWFVAKAERAQGTYTGSSTAAEKMYYAYFTYVDGMGETQSARTSWAGSFNQYDPGAEMPVLYRPERPDRVRIATFPKLWLFPLLMFVPAVAIGGLVIWLMRVRRARAAEAAG